MMLEMPAALQVMTQQQPCKAISPRLALMSRCALAVAKNMTSSET